MAWELEVQRPRGLRGLPDKRSIRRWFEAGFRSAGRRPEPLTLRFVDEAESARLNSRYRSKDHPTNVLSFPMDWPQQVGGPYLGDLAVCAAVVRREAEEQGKRVQDHFAHILVHGLLHLLGYDHEDEAAAAQMEALEREALAALGVGDPYAAE